MPYIAPEVITEAKRMDLLTYLREYEPGELVKFSSNTYTTRTHDSLKISNGKWMWWSRGIGGKSALDYLIKVRGMDFVEAVQTIMGNGSVSFPTCENIKSYENQPLLLPEKSPTTDVVFDYLFGRGIDYEIINYCLEQKLIIESLPYHNAVFIGYDENKEPKYAAYRATNQSRIMGDCTGSKKQYSFRLTAENTGEVHLFECAIDLLSYATLMKLEGKDWRQFNLVSLAGVYSPKQKIEDSKVPVTLGRLLEKDKTIRRIVLHLDNDIAGRKATKALQTILSDMVADVYSHIIDEDRRYNAQKFEEQFYNAKGLKNAEEGKTAPMPKFETSVELLDPMAEVQKESEVEKEKPAENSTDENAALLTKLLSNPETAALLKALAKTI